MQSKDYKKKVIRFCSQKVCVCQKKIVLLHSISDTASEREYKR